MDYTGEPPDDDFDEGRRIRVAASERIAHLIAVGQYEAAKRIASEQIADNPDDPHSLLSMARVLVAQEDWDAALSAIEMVTQRDPEIDDAHYLNAVVLLEVGRFSAAELAVREAITIDPDWGGYRTLYARILTCCERPVDALAQTTVALELDPEDGDALALRSALLATIPRRDIRLSIDTARRAVALDPDDADAHAALGFAHLMSGNHEDAERHCRAALEIDPTNHLALRGLIESTAASSLFYWPMFRYSMWMERLGQGGSFAFVFGLWAVVNAIVGAIRDTPYAEWTGGIMITYLVFCAYTWFARPITMFLLRMKHPWLADHDV